MDKGQFGHGTVFQWCVVGYGSAKVQAGPCVSGDARTGYGFDNNNKGGGGKLGGRGKTAIFESILY